MKMRLILLAGLAAQALVASQAPAAVPTPIEKNGQAGLDMVLADPDGMPAEPEFARDDLPAVEWAEWSGAPADLAGVPVHHLYTDLRRALVRYQLSWGALPQVEVPGTAAIGPDSKGPRVMALRQRLGLAAEGSVDEAVGAKLRSFQAVHGLPVDGLAGTETLAALNRGSAYYERLILLNMERARRLPAPGTAAKFVVVDVGSARLTMYEGGEAVGSMKVVVGAAKSQTPMMATQLRYAAVNPYWNVPPDLVAKLIAPKVMAQGRTYLVDRRYQVLSDWTETAAPLEPEAVNWSAVADGSEELRVRQLPGGANSMGRIKFLMPNQYGIYLHDTPNRALFAQEDRWVSNGCVRLEDADALARWVFGKMPTPADPDREDRLDLDKPIPVYMTYLTAAAGPDGIQFRHDPYDRDAPVLAAMERSLGPLPKLAKADTGPDPLAPGKHGGGALGGAIKAKTADDQPAKSLAKEPVKKAKPDRLAAAGPVSVKSSSGEKSVKPKVGEGAKAEKGVAANTLPSDKSLSRKKAGTEPAKSSVGKAAANSVSNAAKPNLEIAGKPGAKAKQAPATKKNLQKPS